MKQGAVCEICGQVWLVFTSTAGTRHWYGLNLPATAPNLEAAKQMLLTVGAAVARVQAQ